MNEELYDADFNMRKGFSEYSKGLVAKVKFRNLVRRFREDVDYHVERGFDKKEAIRYVKYWYRKLGTIENNKIENGGT